MYGVNGERPRYFKALILLLLFSTLINTAIVNSCKIVTDNVDWKTFYNNIWNNAVKIGVLNYNNTSINVYYYQINSPLITLQSGANCTIRVTTLSGKPYVSPAEIMKKYFPNSSTTNYIIWSLGGVKISYMHYLPYIEIVFSSNPAMLYKYLCLEASAHISLPGGLLELIEKKKNTILVIDAIISLTKNSTNNITLELTRSRIIQYNINGFVAQSIYTEYDLRISKEILMKLYYSRHMFIHYGNNNKYLLVIETRPIISRRSFNPRAIVIVFYPEANLMKNKNTTVDIIESLGNVSSKMSGESPLIFNISKPIPIYYDNSTESINKMYNESLTIYERFTKYYNVFASKTFNNTIKLILSHNLLDKKTPDINIYNLYIIEKDITKIYYLLGNASLSNEAIGATSNNIYDSYRSVFILIIIILIAIAVAPMIAWRKLSRTI